MAGIDKTKSRFEQIQEDFRRYLQEEPVNYVAGLNFVRTSIEGHFIELLLDVGRSSQMSTQRENYAITTSGEGVWEAVQGGKMLS